MRKSENLCNLGENNIISSISNISSNTSYTNNNNNNKSKLYVRKSKNNKDLEKSCNTAKRESVGSTNSSSCNTNQDKNANITSTNKFKNTDNTEQDDYQVDLILAHELAKALRAQDHERFIEIYDFHVPSNFELDRVSDYIIYTSLFYRCLKSSLFDLSRIRIFS